MKWFSGLHLALRLLIIAIALSILVSFIMWYSIDSYIFRSIDDELPRSFATELPRSFAPYRFRFKTKWDIKKLTDTHGISKSRLSELTDTHGISKCLDFDLLKIFVIC